MTTAEDLEGPASALALHAAAVTAAVEPLKIDRREQAIVLPDGYLVHEVAALGERPTRNWGTYQFSDVLDFAAWVKVQAGPETSLWANRNAITAVINDDMGWGDHRGVLTFTHGIDWVIVGGESGPGHRPLDIIHARDLIEQCHQYRVPVFFKQVGGRTPTAGGDEIDGRTWKQFPTGAAA